MNFFDKTITPLGMGCWPIGGAMYEGKTSYGYSQSNDEESIRTIHAALDGGITLFDTAAAYGAGHSERLLGRALKNRHETVIVTKIGVGIDEASRQLTFGEIDPLSVVPAIEACLARLQRDQIDLLLLHQNGLEVSMAQLIFEAMESARKAGKIAGFGWSTDFSQSVLAMSDWEGFVGVEHAMNVLQDAPRIQKVIEEKRLHALIRSPLAMGLLSGKYDIDTKLPTDDVRANAMSHWASYYLDGRPNPDFLNKMETIRELLTVDGRSLVQGAIGWLWAKGEMNIPIPGARTVEQIEGIAGALKFGPLPEKVMSEIENHIEREPENAPERER